uniref:Uncharacterized protein n=1 Tax=Arundo donax TaxID=35708 RepID=A0A0A9HI84_ARUDO
MTTTGDQGPLMSAYMLSLMTSQRKRSKQSTHKASHI